MRSGKSRIGFFVVAMVAVSSTLSAAETAAEAYGPQLSELPDWTGIWHLTEGLLFPGNDFIVYAEDPADGEGFSYGPLPGSYITGVPYNDTYRELYDEKVRRAREEFFVDDPIAGCQLPHGMPRAMGAAPGNLEIIVTPQQTTMIFEWMNQVRRIYTDGRPHPPEEEAWPTVMGHSIGHWDGHTLVVDTVNMRANIFDRSGAPHSEQIHLMERITKIDESTIEVEMVLEDPVAFTESWRVTRVFRKDERPVVNVEGLYCENQRNPIGPTGHTATLPGDTQD